MTSNLFFEKPILNSPYAYPAQHWELDGNGQPTQQIVANRRRAEFITPIPQPRKRKGLSKQEALVFDEGKGLSTQAQQYDHQAVINAVRREVDKWRILPNPADWRVTPETARLLQHWRHHNFSGVRPFFCQIEAVETAIWLTEVAPQLGKVGRTFLDHLDDANQAANPGLARLALKLATGAGKTTVMAMLIAWQTVNAVRRPNSRRFTRGFLLVAPGLTIRDRLRVLQPNDPESYFRHRELVPGDMLPDLERAKIVITNYHAFRGRRFGVLWVVRRTVLAVRARRQPHACHTAAVPRAFLLGVRIPRHNGRLLWQNHPCSPSTTSTTRAPSASSGCSKSSGYPTRSCITSATPRRCWHHPSCDGCIRWASRRW